MEKFTQLCEENYQNKETKLTIYIQKFDNAKIKTEKQLNEFDEWLKNIVIELTTLGKYYISS